MTREAYTKRMEEIKFREMQAKAANFAPQILHHHADLLELREALEIAVEALDRLKICGGGCDGPMGCMCLSRSTREALERVYAKIGEGK